MSEREHETARFIPDIEIPTDLKAMHRLKDDAKADVNRERPPTEAQMPVGIVHDAARIFGGTCFCTSQLCVIECVADSCALLLYSAKTIGLSSRSRRRRSKISC